MPFGEFNIDPSESNRQLQKKTVKLKAERDELIAMVEELRTLNHELLEQCADFDAMVEEVKQLRSENANLRRSNTQMKNRYGNT